MDLWLQITLCVLGVLFLWLLIYTVSVAGLKTGLNLLRRGEKLGFEMSQKLENAALEALQEQQQFYRVKAELTDTDRGILIGLNYAQELLQAVINGSKKQINKIEEELEK